MSQDSKAPAGDDSAMAYFDSTPPPKDLEQTIARADEFIQYQKSQGRRVVLVTSGGTTVPLERRTVRFIDNFSAGNRGAVCPPALLNKV